MTQIATAPDFTAIKTKQQVAWGSGDYAKIGATLQIVGENLAEAVQARPGSRVLDVAAGNGNATLAFARRWSDVTSTDYVGALLDRGRQRAEAEGHSVTFQTADAEDLPFGDGEFDVVASTFGVQFTPDQTKAASELLRVCRPEGRIGLANWTPDGFVGGLFKTLGAHISPPAGVSPPTQWGVSRWLTEQFGYAASDLSINLTHFDFIYPSPQHFVDFFRAYYGPVERAFASLDADGQSALESDLLDLVDEFNIAKDGTMRVPSEYAQVVVTKS